ncbi:MAG: GNAT family N-acetyltransferase [Chitinophagaceae bacterium]|nr:MAG: GNAT family N-acetyltransferase [Chitinophagaceae bacterium]
MTYAINPTTWRTDKASLMFIREQVFVQEQCVPVVDEWDDKDETATHFLVRTTEGNPIACARLLIENGAGKNLFHIGRVAVLAEHRKHGVGRNLMKDVISYCKALHINYKIYLHAQLSRQHFYEHLGFVAQGTTFMDAGIPHIEMWFFDEEVENTL